MARTDQVMIFADADLRERKHILPWNGSWPPAERIAVVCGRSNPEIPLSILTASEGQAALELACQNKYRQSATEIYVITHYARTSYSKLPDDHRPGVIRAGAYVPCDGWDGPVAKRVDE